MWRLGLVDAVTSAPRWQKVALGVVGLALVTGVAYFLLIGSVDTRVTALRAQRDGQRNELVRLRALAVEVTRLRREAAEVEARLEAVKERLPSEREIPGLYRTLSDAAVQSGLAVALFQPREPRVRDFYSEIPIALVAEGGYHEVGDFIGRMSMLPRATTVGELRLSTPPSPPRSGSPRPESPRAPGPEPQGGLTITDAGRPRRSVRAEMTVLTYVYRPVGSPPAPKPPGGAAKPEGPKP